MQVSWVCFNQWIHFLFQMHTSQGSGGYCDCGDKEAWSTDPACLIHLEGLSVDESWVNTKNLITYL